MFGRQARFGLAPTRQIGDGLNRLIKQMRLLQQALIGIGQPCALFSGQLSLHSMQLTAGHKHLQTLHAADSGKVNVRFIGSQVFFDSGHERSSANAPTLSKTDLRKYRSGRLTMCALSENAIQVKGDQPSPSSKAGGNGNIITNPSGKGSPP